VLGKGTGGGGTTTASASGSGGSSGGGGSGGGRSGKGSSEPTTSSEAATPPGDVVAAESSAPPAGQHADGPGAASAASSSNVPASASSSRLPKAAAVAAYRAPGRSAAASLVPEREQEWPSLGAGTARVAARGTCATTDRCSALIAHLLECVSGLLLIVCVCAIDQWTLRLDPRPRSKTDPLPSTLLRSWHTLIVLAMTIARTHRTALHHTASNCCIIVLDRIDLL